MLISLYFSPRISDSILWSLIGLYFGRKLLHIPIGYGIFHYDRIAAGTDKETPQMRGFQQAAVLDVRLFLYICVDFARARVYNRNRKMQQG